MAQKTMYPAKDGSPSTTTLISITTETVLIEVADLGVLPDGTGICRIYTGPTHWERCIYTNKSNTSGQGTVTIARTGDGHASTDALNAALAFDVGAKVERDFSAYDHYLFKYNIEDLASRVSSAESTVSGHTTSIGTNTSDISSLDGRLDTAESTISGHTTDIAAKAGAPATTTENKVAQWSGTQKTLKDGLTVGTAANNLVQLDGSAKLPAVDASAVTGLIPTQITGTFATSQMPTDAKRTVILLGSTAEYPAANAAASDSVEMSTNKQVVAGTKFAAGATDTYAQWRFRLPLNYKASAGFTFRTGFFLKSESAASTNVIFGLQALIIGDAGSLDTAWGTAVEVTTDVSGVAANVLKLSSVSSALTPAKAPSGLTVAGGEEIIFRLYRKGDDTSAADVVLTDVYLTYTTEAYEDA